MIRCLINGTQGYPSIQSEIKLTMENPYVTEGDTFTMEIVFPMDIPENATLFGHLHRMDVSKDRHVSFDKCSLYVDNLLIVQGSGRVTEITESTVKLQILGGNSNVKFKSKFQKVYIDRINTYPMVANKYKPSNVSIDGVRDIPCIQVYDEIHRQGYVGDISQYVFMPTYDVDNDVIANCCCMVEDKTEMLLRSAVQPNLMMVLVKVLNYVGYTVRNNAFDVDPWNKLIIASARQTISIAQALPHWTVETFLYEFRNFFNASFLFDDINGTVDIVHNNELDSSNDVTYEVEEEYKTNYEEDGIEYVGGSNIKFNMKGYDRTLDDFPQELRNSFPILEYNSYSALANAFAQMSQKEQFTNIFHCPRGFFFCGHEYNVDGEDTGNFTLTPFGMFGPLYRHPESDTFLEMKMYPAQMRWDKYNFGRYVYVLWCYAKTDFYGKMYLPNVPNEKGNDYIDYDEKGYVSVSNVLEDGESSGSEETEEDAGMPLLWVEEIVAQVSDDRKQDVPASFTDMRNSRGGAVKTCSLCLQDPWNNTHYLGELHRGGLSEESTVDTNTEYCYKFLMEGKPDPTKIYSFRNKRFLCKKVEVRITSEGIDRMKTGYFYEIKL